MFRSLGILALLAFVATACQPAPTLRLSEEPVTEDGLHLVMHRGQGRMVVAPDLERVRLKIRSSQNIFVTRCQVALKDTTREAELADQLRKLNDDFCAVFKSHIGRAQDHAAATDSPVIRAENATMVDAPGADTMAIESWLINVEIDERSGALLRGSQPTMGVLVTDSVSNEPLMRYYSARRVSGSMDDLVISSTQELYAIYARILYSGQTDVAAPGAR